MIINIICQEDIGRIVGTYNGYVQVCATAPEMAPANSFRKELGFLSPSGVRHLLTDS